MGTGQIAEREGGRWLAFEERLDYLAASSFRFFSETATEHDLVHAYDSLMAGEAVDFQRAVYAPAAFNGHSTVTHTIPASDHKRAETVEQGLLLLREEAGPSDPLPPRKPVKYKKTTRRASDDSS